MQGWLATALPIAVIVVDVVIRVLAVVFVPKNRRPATATAWLLAIFFIPYAGLIAFLLFGSTKLPRRRRAKQAQVNRYVMHATEGIDLATETPDWPPWFASLAALNRRLGAMPLLGGNTARLLGDYDASIAEMTAAVRSAETFVHVEFYILSLDRTTAPFFDAMEEALARGVTVRVLLDHIASLRVRGYRRTIRRLKAMGADWHLLLPVQPYRGRYQRPDLRNHRKVLVVDGRVGFMGSQNMIDRTYDRWTNRRRGLRWQDLMVRLEGPIVAELNTIFISDWFAETDVLLERAARQSVAPVGTEDLDCQVVPSGPGFERENNLRLFNGLIYAAQRRVVLVSPYFVPDDSMLYAVTTAAQRGVEVELFVSEIGDQAVVFHAQRSYYEALLKAGVVIWLYRKPTILHAKHFTIDDDVAVVGSSNLDMRSFTLNLEVSLMVRGRAFVDDLRVIEEGYRRESRRLTLDEWDARPFRSAVLDDVARLTAAIQ
ncbi:cardiolipin synthase [Amnibacterium kyonggiense]|uniref:Cardiolipin synthase n=1 Tax=Amnibacterium kyonggiense TaxID=595671 RepID=A0A4R7FPG3_9MICO|nr:cardiolipin synthase [Amnibacterium kyonggiense]TDS79635.1 cardiolipin synthetase 2 [Amnibacterium kyonggiense]